MRIALVSSRFFPVIGGGETYVYQLIDKLSERGHDVTLVTNRTNEQTSTTSYRIKYIDGFDERNPEILASLPQLHNFFEKNKFDIVHVCNVIPYFLVVNSISEQQARKLILTINNTPNPPHTVFGLFGNYEDERAFLRKLLNDYPPRAAIFGSSHFVNSFKNYFSGVTDLVHIPFGVDFKLFSQAHKYKGTSDKKIILCTSRFVYRKGIPQLIEALAKLPTDYHLVLTGSVKPEGKETFENIVRLIAKYKLQNRVVFIRKQLSYEEMPMLYAMADVFVLPSLFEGFGMATIEAMAAKTPAIGSRVEGTRDIITNGSNGLLYDYGDVEKLAFLIKELAKDAKLRTKIIDNAYSVAKKRYDLEHSITQHENLYHEQLALKD